MRPRKHNRHLPPCVYLRHGAYYYVRRGKWIRLGATLKDALARYARLASTERGDMVGLIDRTIERAREQGKSENTLRQYETAGAYLREALVEFAVDEVKPHHIAAIMDHYSDRPNMGNRMRTVLKLAFALAIREGVRETNPANEVAPWREKKRRRYLTDAEWRAIHAEASPALRCIMEIAYYTGQRIGDVLAIRQADVTEDGIYVHQQKTGAQLLVRETPELRAAVRRCRALFPVTPMYLLGQKNGRIRSYTAARDLLRRAAKRAGVEDVRWHDFRAKAITDAHKQGLNDQALAGHTTEAQTVRYRRSREVPVVEGPSFKERTNGKTQDN